MDFHENASLKVVAALRRGELPGQTGRRSEIGSHTPPKTAIFIGRDELNKSWRTSMAFVIELIA
jgi:hypothetical protein